MESAHHHLKIKERKSIEFLHTNKGVGETSYARNSHAPRKVILLSNAVIEEAVRKCLNKTTTLTSLGVADLGCSSRPNTLIVISKIIDIVHARCSQMGIVVPELRLSLNDLPDNDFNNVLRTSLPEFYGKIKDKGIDRCFVSVIAGTFYGRLVLENSMHFVNSAYSFHWLSQGPERLCGKHINKEKIYISKASSACAAEAYLSQFQVDLFAFLKSRAADIVTGGQMVLSFVGRNPTETPAQSSSHQWDLLAQALMSLASEGVVEEEKIDAFNVPYYAASPDEVKGIIEKEGSFMIDHLQKCKVGWEEGFNDELGKLSKGQRFGKIARALMERMLDRIFGREIMDELFARFGQLVDVTAPPYLLSLTMFLSCSLLSQGLKKSFINNFNEYAHKLINK